MKTIIIRGAGEGRSALREALDKEAEGRGIVITEECGFPKPEPEVFEIKMRPMVDMPVIYKHPNQGSHRQPYKYHK